MARGRGRYENRHFFKANIYTGVLDWAVDCPGRDRDKSLRTITNAVKHSVLFYCMSAYEMRLYMMNGLFWTNTAWHYAQLFMSSLATFE